MIKLYYRVEGLDCGRPIEPYCVVMTSYDTQSGDDCYGDCSREYTPITKKEYDAYMRAQEKAFKARYNIK